MSTSAPDSHRFDAPCRLAAGWLHDVDLQRKKRKQTCMLTKLYSPMRVSLRPHCPHTRPRPVLPRLFVLAAPPLLHHGAMPRSTPASARNISFLILQHSFPQHGTFEQRAAERATEPSLIHQGKTLLKQGALALSCPVGHLMRSMSSNLSKK
ncbi:hypothetical protein EJB05_52103, partial [Eragrostis curvula]